MGYHTPGQIEKLKKELETRMRRLVDVIEGRETKEQELPPHAPSNTRFVAGTEVRVAADDFMTILREIKGSFGKR